MAILNTQKPTKPKAIVISNGGINSIILLHYVKSFGFDINILSFGYKNLNKLQLNCVIEQSKLIKTNHHKIVDTNNINYIFTDTENDFPIILSMATGWAKKLRIDTIFYSFNYDNKDLNNDIKIINPFINFTDLQILKFGNLIGVDFSKTWSCFENENIHCGKCSGCNHRKQLFKLLKLEDKIQYVQ